MDCVGESADRGATEAAVVAERAWAAVGVVPSDESGLARCESSCWIIDCRLYWLTCSQLKIVNKSRVLIICASYHRRNQIQSSHTYT